MTEERMIETIPRRLRGLLRARGMSQKALAVEIGVTTVAVYRYLAGQSVPQVGIVIRMAKALHTTTGYILTGDTARQDGILLYECDPEKNPYCRKTGCAWGENRGPCYLTAYAEARAE